MERSVYIAVPHYGSIHPFALPGLTFPSRSNKIRVQPNGASLLNFNFNRMLADALNERSTAGHTHFAMHHADIQADPYWVDTLADEMDRLDADIISAVVPIKDSRGLTSTGWMDAKSNNIVRLTLKETHRLPETFSAAAVETLFCPRMKPGDWLMVNTGLMLWNLRKPWVDEFPGFTSVDGISRQTGQWRAHVTPEDWYMSFWAAKKNLRVFATRKVKVTHHGVASYSNDGPWGDWDHDQGDEPKKGD